MGKFAETANLGKRVLHRLNSAEEAGKARFNVATPTCASVTCTRHVQHTYHRINYKQNPFNIISRGMQGCISTDFRLK